MDPLEIEVKRRIYANKKSRESIESDLAELMMTFSSFNDILLENESNFNEQLNTVSKQLASNCQKLDLIEGNSESKFPSLIELKKEKDFWKQVNSFFQEEQKWHGLSSEITAAIQREDFLKASIIYDELKRRYEANVGIMSKYQKSLKSEIVSTCFNNIKNELKRNGELKDLFQIYKNLGIEGEYFELFYQSHWQELFSLWQESRDISKVVAALEDLRPAEGSELNCWLYCVKKTLVTTLNPIIRAEEKSEHNLDIICYSHQVIHTFYLTLDEKSKLNFEEFFEMFKDIKSRQPFLEIQLLKSGYSQPFIHEDFRMIEKIFKQNDELAAALKRFSSTFKLFIAALKRAQRLGNLPNIPNIYSLFSIEWMKCFDGFMKNLNLTLDGETWKKFSKLLNVTSYFVDFHDQFIMETSDMEFECVLEINDYLSSLSLQIQQAALDLIISTINEGISNYEPNSKVDSEFTKVFSLSPSHTIIGVGEILLSLPHHLESFENEKGFVPLFPHKEDNMCLAWITFICSQFMVHLKSAIGNETMDADFTKGNQLSVDLEYLVNIFNALQVEVEADFVKVLQK